jgi:VanZ family protein
MHLAESSERLCRRAFFLFLLLFVYGTLFPFYFNLEPEYLARAWAQVRLVPYWNLSSESTYGFPDIVSNILFGLPLGFFGYLWLAGNRGQSILKWGFIGLSLGCAVELMQLSIPYRTTSATDALNDGLGSLLGAILARYLGKPILAVLMGTWEEPRQTRALLLLCVLLLCTLGPLDLTFNISDIEGDLDNLMRDPWKRLAPLGDEWILAASFTIFAAMIGSLLMSGKAPLGVPRPYALPLLLLLPWALEMGQFLVASRLPSIREPLVASLACCLGLLAARSAPALVRPLTGLLLMTAAILAFGLSPFVFEAQEGTSSFQWIPLLEYYLHTSAGSLYDAGFGLLSFALFAACFRASFGSSRLATIAAALGLATVMEIIQMYVPYRYPGTTDIAIAALGALIGDVVESNIEGGLTSNGRR